MTDAETFAAICADFPFTTEALASLHRRLVDLRDKTQNIGPGCGDGTIDEATWKRLKILAAAIGETAEAMIMIETDGDPEEWIPF